MEISKKFHEFLAFQGKSVEIQLMRYQKKKKIMMHWSNKHCYKQVISQIRNPFPRIIFCYLLTFHLVNIFVRITFVSS